MSENILKGILPDLSGLTTEQRIARLENLIALQGMCIANLEAKLGSLVGTSELDAYVKTMMNQWDVHPDGDFDKTYSNHGTVIVDTEYRYRHLIKEIDADGYEVIGAVRDIPTEWLIYDGQCVEEGDIFRYSQSLILKQPIPYRGPDGKLYHLGRCDDKVQLEHVFFRDGEHLVVIKRYDDNLLIPLDLLKHCVRLPKECERV